MHSRRNIWTYGPHGQEEEDTVEPIAGARGLGRCQRDGKAPLCLQRRLWQWKDIRRADDWSSFNLSNFFDSFFIIFHHFWVMWKMESQVCLYQQLVAAAPWSRWSRRQDVIGGCPGRLCDLQSSGEPHRQGDAMGAIAWFSYWENGVLTCKIM